MKKLIKTILIVTVALVVMTVMSVSVFAVSTTWSSDGWSCNANLNLSTKSASASLHCTPNPGPVSGIETCSLSGTAYLSNGEGVFYLSASGEYENGSVSCADAKYAGEYEFGSASCTYYFGSSSRYLSDKL